MPDRFELPPIDGMGYFAFVDPSGGSQDSMTLAIAHRENPDRTNKTVVLDAVREAKPPFSPEQVVMDFCKLLKQYRVHVVTGDRYAGEWPREQFSKHGVRYKAADQAKSDLYRDLLPLLYSGRCQLLDNQKLISQLCDLERRVGRSGKDSIDHAPGGHDDVVNAAAGALTVATRYRTWNLVWGNDRASQGPSFLKDAVVGSLTFSNYTIIGGKS